MVYFTSDAVLQVLQTICSDDKVELDFIFAGLEEKRPSAHGPSAQRVHGEASTGRDGLCWRGDDGQRPLPQVIQL